MKSTLIFLLLTASVTAQTPASKVLAACGPKDMKFQVNETTKQSSDTSPTPDQARVYFVQDDGPAGTHQHFTTKVAIDGSWVGAYKHNAFFDLPVSQGEHHVCVNVQSSSSAGQLVAFAHFTAEPGKTYFFRTRFLSGINTIYPTPPYLNLEPIDSDEAAYLLSIYPRSIATPNHK